MTIRTLGLSVALLACAFLAGKPVAADQPKAFACNFTKGVTHVYDKGEFAAEKAAPISFGIETIDTAAQSADLKTEHGTGTLRIVQAVNATHFLEVVTEGSLHITTVFDKDEAKGLYPAVHSRHFGLLGQPIITQYQGFCKGSD
jgi:hypothetical protein